jgi:hypothetical protein
LAEVNRITGVLFPSKFPEHGFVEQPAPSLAVHEIVTGYELVVAVASMGMLAVPVHAPPGAHSQVPSLAW